MQNIHRSVMIDVSQKQGQRMPASERHQTLSGVDSSDRPQELVDILSKHNNYNSAIQDYVRVSPFIYLF